jgi:hypothetical protein
MLPRHPRSKDSGGSKFFKPKFFTIRGFALSIEPLLSPARIVFGRGQVEVRDIRADLATKSVGLELQGLPDHKNPVPKHPVGFDPQEAFTERDKTRNVENYIRVQIVKLNPIRKKKAAKKGMWGKR